MLNLRTRSIQLKSHTKTLHTQNQIRDLYILKHGLNLLSTPVHHRHCSTVIVLFPQSRTILIKMNHQFRTMDTNTHKIVELT